MKKIIYLAVLVLPILGVQKAYSEGDPYQAGMDLYQQGQYKRAISQFQMVLQSKPDSWRALQMLGESQYKTGQKEEALQAIQQSLKIHPDNPNLVAFEKIMESPVPVDETKSLEKSNPSGSPKKASSHPLDKHPFTLKANWVLGYALNDDLVNGIAKNASTDPPGIGFYTTNGDGHNPGTGFNLEADYSLDSSNAIGFDYEVASTATVGGLEVFNTYFIDSTHQLYEDLSQYSSTLFFLKYYRYFPDDLGRWFIALGVGYHAASFHYSYSYQNGGAPTNADYDLSGSTLSFALGFGRELVIFDWLGLEVSGDIRYDYVAGITGPGFGGTATLATSSGGGLAVVDKASIGSGGLRQAAVDYSGVYGRFGLNFYP